MGNKPWSLSHGSLPYIKLMRRTDSAIFQVNDIPMYSYFEKGGLEVNEYLLFDYIYQLVGIFQNALLLNSCFKATMTLF